MNVKTVRPTRATTLARKRASVLSAAIAGLLASASPAFAAFPGPPSAPCEGVGNCADDGLRYTDWSFVTQEVSEHADGSGERVQNYMAVGPDGWRINGIGEGVLYTYITGSDEYGNPIVEYATSYASAPVMLNAGQTINMAKASAIPGGARIMNLADGIDGMDAVNKRQLDAAMQNAGGNDPLAVKYTDGNRNAVSVGGRVMNVADGQAGNDSANMGQLWGVANVAQDGVNRANTAQGRADAATTQAVVAYNHAEDARNSALTAQARADKGVNDAATALSRAEVGVYDASLAQSRANAAFNDARAAQVQADLGVANAATAQARADLAVDEVGALNEIAVKYTDGSQRGVLFGTQEAGPVSLSNVADGVADNDAVNVAQLRKVAGDLEGVAGDALMFNGVSYDATRGGTATRISGVADGVEEGDAVNKRQLDAVATDVGQVSDTALLFDGVTYNATRGGAATRISGVADGVDTGDAVNKGQLDTVSGQLQDLDGLAVKYTDASHTAVVLGTPEAGAVRLSNVADGADDLDAVNKRQLDAVATDVGQVSDNALLFDGQAYNATREGAATRITGVAAALTGSDAVNFDQVSALTAVFGGGVSWSNGTLTNPTYSISGGNYASVGDALAAVDSKLANLDGRVGGVETSPALNRPVLYDDSRKDAVTLEGVNGTRISNVQAGVNGTDAANVDQVRQGISESRTYTDTKTQETLRDAKAYTDTRVDDMWRGMDEFSAHVDRRFHETDKRITRQSAMTAAMVNMATNAAGSRSERGRIGAGLGWSSGERALSIGYSRAIGERASFSIGGALSGGESSAGVGFGIDL